MEELYETKNHKKIISLVLSAFMLIGMTNTLVSAKTTTSTDVDGDLSISEGAKPYVQTAEDLQLVNAKLKNLDARSTSTAVRSTASAASDAPLMIRKLDVIVFKQTETYWCGPATVKQVLHYINGSSLSQKTYANKDNLNTTTSGTNMVNIDGVLNKYQTRNRYVYSQFANYDEWHTRVRYDMVYGIPTVIDINSIGNSNWKYSTEGHFLCISGYDNSSGTLYNYVADPHYTYPGTYKYKASVVYAVNRAHFRSAVIF